MLLMVAHPNDEFGLAATLRAHVNAGDEVWAAWFARDDRDDVRVLRRAEAHMAMSRIGVPAEHLLEADLPAVDLASQLPEVVLAAREARRIVRPTLVYVPAFEGGHPDHDALNFVAWETFALDGVAVREFPIYRHSSSKSWLRRVPSFGQLLPGVSDPDVKQLGPGERGFKRGLWRVYKTQRPLFDVLLRLSGDRRHFFTTEETRPLPLRDYTKPPHDPPLLYEETAATYFTFAEFASAVRRYHWAGGLEEQGI